MGLRKVRTPTQALSDGLGLLDLNSKGFLASVNVCSTGSVGRTSTRHRNITLVLRCSCIAGRCAVTSRQAKPCVNPSGATGAVTTQLLGLGIPGIEIESDQIEWSAIPSPRRRVLWMDKVDDGLQQFNEGW